MQWDVIVVGGGAAGLLAATRAAERGKRTLLLEKNRKPGAKILMSGGTRCNITQATDRRGIVEAFGSQGPFLHSALAALGPDDLVALFEAEGVATKVEPTGKVFPASDKALDVLTALRARLRRSGCELATEEPLAELTRSDHGFQLKTTSQLLRANQVIVSTGGKSYPGCGTTGDGYRWLSGLGHTIAKLRPALTPVVTNIGWVASLSGVTIGDVALRVMTSSEDKQVCLAAARDSFLFTHFGLSGPAVLDVSRAITGHPQPQSLKLECDFLPKLRQEELDEQLQRDCAAAGKKHLAAIVSNRLPRRLAEALLTELQLGEVRAAELSKKDRHRLLAAMKRTMIPVAGTRGFKKAEVTAGGVVLDEVDSRTMQSKRVPNLFVVGEILDLDGPIGGYNFQAAFSTAWLAGDSV